MSIKPGMTVDINIDPSSAGAGTLKAVVHDVRGRSLILSQTSPPLRPPPPRDPVDISYLVMKGTSARRFGFSAVISGFNDDYELSAGMRVPAVIVEMKQQPEETSLRKGFRVRTARSSGLALAIQTRNYPIFDISLTGVNFIQPGQLPPFRPSALLECRLTIDGRNYLLKARVVRIVETGAARNIAAVFVNPGRDLQPALSRKILQMEREDLSGHR